MKSLFQQNIKVQNHECDFKNRFKFDCIAKRAQQISIDHTNLLNLKKNFYKKNNLALLVSSVVIEIKKVVFCNEDLKVVTEVFKTRRVFQRRETSFFNDKNELAIKVFADWILINTKERKILRSFPKALVYEDSKENTQSLDRIKKVESEVFLREEVAYYSRCDINFHLNHTEYISLIFDALPIFMLKEAFPKKLVINYKKEILLREMIKIYISNKKKSYYFSGKNSENDFFFQANVEF